MARILDPQQANFISQQMAEWADYDNKKELTLCWDPDYRMPAENLARRIEDSSYQVILFEQDSYFALFRFGPEEKTRILSICGDTKSKKSWEDNISKAFKAILLEMDKLGISKFEGICNMDRECSGRFLNAVRSLAGQQEIVKKYHPKNGHVSVDLALSAGRRDIEWQH